MYIYINWKSCAPNNWKWGILETLLARVFDISSIDKYLKEELEYLRAILHDTNNYPLSVITADAKKIPSADQNDSSNNDKIYCLMLQY